MATEPHLHTCLVSYKRRPLTERTLESYLETVTVSHSLVIVDNGSPPDVTDWLRSLDVDVVLLPENRYPGYATNRGWDWVPAETTLYQRLDNDARLLPGWCDGMLEAFADPQVGQYGLTAEGCERWTSRPGWPVGGFSIIRSELYDAGLRYDERPWSPDWPGEDTPFTQEVLARGYRRVFSARPALEYLDDGDFGYRTVTHVARGLTPKSWGEG